MTPLSCIRPPKKPRSPMPVLSLLERKNGWFRSSGRSSSQILSSFCQKAIGRVGALGVLDDVGEGAQRPRRGGDRRRAGRTQARGGAARGRPRPVGAEAPPAGAGAAEPVTKVWKVVQPPSAAAARTRPETRAARDRTC